MNNNMVNIETYFEKGDLVEASNFMNISLGIVIGKRKFDSRPWYVYVFRRKRSFYYSSRELRKLSK